MQLGAWKGSTWLIGVALFVGLCLLEFLLIAPDHLLPVHDGLFHFLVAENISPSSPWFNIPWLPYTVLGAQGPDHQWFWHLLISPFTWFEDRVLGLKLAIAFYFAAVPTAIYCFCVRQKIPWPLLWALLGVTAALVAQRYALLRTQNLAVIFILLAITAILERRYILLGATAFAYMLSYHGAIILLPISGLACLIFTLQQRQLVFLPLLVSCIGILFGLVLNPWFPQTIEYLLFHTLYKMGNVLQAGVGQEWEPLSFVALLQQCWDSLLPLIILLALFIQQFRAKTKIPRELWLLLGLVIMFLVLYKFAWRFREYFVPICAVFCGLLLRETIDELQPKLKTLLLVVLIGLCMTSGWRSLNEYQKTQLSPNDYFALRGGYLQNHAGEGDVVFNTDWGDLPQMIWWAPQTVYVTGLDAHYLAYENPELFNLWMQVGFTGLPEGGDPIAVLQQEFDARWVVISTFIFKYGHALELYNFLIQDPRAVLRATDRQGWLFELKPNT